jgi:integrase/recombinase XerC
VVPAKTRSNSTPGRLRSSSIRSQRTLFRTSVRVALGPVRRELGVFLKWKERAGEPLEAGSPLFLSRQGRRVSLRRIQFIFREWQRAAGFEALYPFHALRHTAITNVYRATKDLYLTQRFARHSSPLTTTCYTHPTDEELYAALRGLTS